jgi:hypothetical protein
MKGIFVFLICCLICCYSNASEYQIEGFEELKWRSPPSSDMIFLDKRRTFSFYERNNISYEFCNNELCGVSGVIKGRNFDDVYNSFVEAYGEPGCINHVIVWFGETDVLLCQIDTQIYFLYFYNPLHIIKHHKYVHKYEKKKEDYGRKRKK